MKKIILAAWLFGSAVGYSQNFDWLKTPSISLQLNVNGTGYSVITDNSNNIYFAGLKENPVSRTEQLGHLYFIKYDAEGNELFNKTITCDSAVYNMAADSNGNVVMILGFHDSVAVSGDISMTAEPDETSNNHFALAKYSSAGNLLWAQRLFIDEINRSVADAKAIAFDAQDNLYVGYDNYNHSYITKYSNTGEEVFTIQQTGVAGLTSLSIDTEGNIYAAGSCADPTVQFGDRAINIMDDYNIYMVKYNRQGMYQWHKSVQDITCSEPHVVARTPDEVYFSSALFGNYAFDTITAEGPTFSDDFFITRLNASGEYQWLREVPGGGTATHGNRNYLALDNQGNVYFGGSTRFTVNWTDEIATAPTSGSDALVLKYNPDGNLLSAITAGGEGYNRTDAVAINTQGELIMAGIANGTTAFGNITHEAGRFERYPFVAKVSQNTMKVNDAKRNTVKLYPNPAQNYLYINGLENTFTGSISNALGQKIQDFKADASTPVDISNLSKGIYFLKAEGMATVKFIKK